MAKCADRRAAVRIRSGCGEAGKVASASRSGGAPAQREIASMTQIENQFSFARRSAPAAPAIKTLLLITALLAYAAGFVVLYPLAASSVAASEAESGAAALMQFVGP
jgi:hypothetical protein